MALVTTFLTTPLTTALYPPWYQIHAEQSRRSRDSSKREDRNDSVAAVKDQLKTIPVRKLLVYLRLDGLSGICTVAALLSNSRKASSPQIHPTRMPKQTEQAVEDSITPADDDDATLRIRGVRLMELTDRDSSVMKVSAGQQALWDPVVNTFRAFGEWHDLSLMAGVSVVPEHSYADTVVEMAQPDTADLLLLPWSETGTLVDRQNGLEVDVTGRFANGAYSQFVANVLERVPGHVGILIENGPESRSATKRPTPQRSASGLSLKTSAWSRPPTGNRSHHFIFPFFGGEDDRFALRFILQLAQNDQVTASIIQTSGSANGVKIGVSTTVSASGSRVIGNQPDIVFFETLRDSIPGDLKDRVIFKQPELQGSISDPVALAAAAVKGELDQTPSKYASIVVVGRRSIESEVSLADGPSVEDGIGTNTRQVLGPVGSAIVHLSSVLVMQAGVETQSFERQG